MSRYTFGRNKILIEIEDLKFETTFNQDLFDRQKAISKKANKVLKELEEGQENDEEILLKTSQFFRGAIDEILGDGVSQRIFDKRERDVIEEMDVMMYIIEEITQYENNRYKPATPQVPAVVINKKSKKKRK